MRYFLLAAFALLPHLAPAEPLRYLALGDSYTCGEGVPVADRYAVQLAEKLGNVAAPTVIAQTGWTGADLLEAVAGEGGTYDLVTLLIGVNNQYQGLDPEDFRREFKALLDTAARLAGERRERVVVLSIPDWSATPFGQSRGGLHVAKEIDVFNAVVREECEGAGIALVDITPLSRQATGDTRQFASDGLHYSRHQYAQWVEAMLPVVKKGLGP